MKPLSFMLIAQSLSILLMIYSTYCQFGDGPISPPALAKATLREGRVDLLLPRNLTSTLESLLSIFVDVSGAEISLCSLAPHLSQTQTFVDQPNPFSLFKDQGTQNNWLTVYLIWEPHLENNPMQLRANGSQADNLAKCVVASCCNSSF